jgi:carotenoid cleavage dioxygenase-like enzyme
MCIECAVRESSLFNCRWYDTGRTGFHWHCVNGWETEDNKVVLYMPLFDKYDSSMPIHIASEPESKLHKFVLDLEGGTVDGGLVEATKVHTSMLHTAAEPR